MNYSLLKKFVPPIILEIRAKLGRRRGWFGDYKNWESAKLHASGYSSNEIIKRVEYSLSEVKNGRAAFERDSVLFNKIEYSWPLLSALLLTAARSMGSLNVLDFGGSLGTTYFQNLKFFRLLKKVNWSVVEQEEFVKIGRQSFQNSELKFFNSIEQYLTENSPKTILLSSVLQYLEKPYDFLEYIVNLNFEYIVFDRTSFNVEFKDRLTVQIVPKEIYAASYPCWFLNQKKFIAIIEVKYNLIEEFDALDKANIPSLYKGYIFERKRNE
jgi:putative methyltransferase (TIGR04325 family)